MIEDPSDPRRTLLAVGRDGSYQLIPSLMRDGELLAPLSRHDPILRRATLPKGAAAMRAREGVGVASPEVLMRLVVRFIEQRVAVERRYLIPLAAFVVATWLVDRFEVAPYLMVVGPPVSGKTTLLIVLALLCRRSFLVGDISSSALFHVCAQIHPTFLLDESASQVGQSDSAMRHFLRMGSTREGIVRKGEFFDAFSAKVLAVLEPPNDTALNSRCLTIPTIRANPEVKDLREPAVIEYAARLRAALLLYRLDNWTRIRSNRIPGSEHLSPRAQDLLACLSAATPDKDGREYLLAHFKAAGECVEEDIRTVVIRLLNLILYKLIHAPSEENSVGPGMASSIRVKYLTDTVNRELQLRGETGKLSAESVGHLLTALGLARRYRTSSGMRLLLDLSAKRRIHTNAETYGQEALRLDYGPQAEECTLCKENCLDQLLGKIPPAPEHESKESAEPRQKSSLGEIPS
jgi:hypothetical protein